MRKPILLLAACAVAFASCQKSDSGSSTYTCSCKYTYVTGFTYVDTTVATTYANGTTEAAAQYNCSTQQTNLLASPGVKSANCFLK